MEDLADALEIVSASRPSDRECARREIRDALSEKTAFCAAFYVCEKDERVVGLHAFRPDPDPDASGIYWREWLFVHPACWRMGIGGVLTDFVEDRIRELGGRKIYMDLGNEADQPESLAFHLKRGYKKEGHFKDYFRAGEDKLIFAKALDKNTAVAE